MADWKHAAPPMRREAHYGDRVALCYERRARSLHQVLEHAVEARPEAEAVVCGAERLTWSELANRAASLSGWLRARGVAPGDRVGLLLGNGWPFVVAMFAVGRLGAIGVPVSTRISGAELRYVLEDCAAVALLYDPALSATARAADRIDAVKTCVAFDDEAGRVMLSMAPAPIQPVNEQDVALIIYTSGTTGRPKGAEITHLGVIHSATNYVACMGLDETDRFLAAVPLSNISGLVALIMSSVHARAALVILPEFRASDFLAAVSAERISYTLMAPAMYNLCLLQANLAQHDLSSWRVGAFGAAPMPPSTIERLRDLVPNLRLMNVYGATETTSPATILPAADVSLRPRSVGLPVPGCEIVIMDADACEAPPGVVGEVWIRGPMVAKGYWNNPAATAREFVAGFWKSGDLGSLDPDGYLQVHDRQKDMINRGGYKIFSAEVEAAIAAHPSVQEAAVVARACPVLGERVHAVVVLRADRPPVTDVELDAFVGATLSEYKRPESWSVVTEPLPRNANGKVIKTSLREHLEPTPLRPT